MFHYLLIHACIWAIFFSAEKSSADLECNARFNKDHDCLLFDQNPSRVLRGKENREKTTLQDRKPRHRPNKKSADGHELEESEAVPLADLEGVTFLKAGDGEITRVSQGTSEIEQYFADGLFNRTFDSLIIRNIEPMIGSWRLMPDVSESTDAIFQALGVSALKRSLMRDYESLTEIGHLQTSRPALSLKTHLPLSIVKQANVYVDGKTFTLSDSDTGSWNAVAVIYNGVLLQKRVSTSGVMYDVRATLSGLPNQSESSPIHIFKWTFIDRRGRKLVAHRYFRKE